MEVKIDESKIPMYAEKFLKIGEEAGIQPHELVIVMSITTDFLKKQLGLEIYKKEEN